MSGIEEETIVVDGIETFCRRVPGEGPPAVFLHGNPTHSGDWVPFLERMRGPAVAFDMPGFGRSQRPSPREFDYSMHGQAGFFSRFLDQLGIDDYALVAHDWGVVGLIPAQDSPERVRRLVAINVLPFLPGYRWHWAAQIWRRRGLGELADAMTTRAGAVLALSQSRADRRQMPRDFVDSMWRYRDRGMTRAARLLYRSAPPDELEAAGRHLERLSCPALVVWGVGDPYIEPEFGRRYAERLPNAELVSVPDAGHWPWIERPDLVERVVAFLDGT